MEGTLSLGALFVLGMVLSPQEDSLRLDELFWFLQSYRFHYHKKKRKKHNSILSPMYGTKYSNTIHPELQLVLLLACPLLPQGRELYAGFYPSVGAFCFGTIWTAASPSSWWRNQATWQHFVSETRRQHFLWIWKKSTDLPRFCRVVIDIKHQNSFCVFVSDILVCKFKCPDQSESSFETISEFQSSVSSKEAFCNKEPLYLPCSWLMNMKCKAARNSRHWPFPTCS